MFVKGTITDIVFQLPSSSLSLQQELSVKVLISTTLSSFPPPMSESQVYNIIDNKFNSTGSIFSSLSLQLREIENVLLTELTSLRALYSFCSSGNSKPTGEAITYHFEIMLQRISVLEMN